MLDLEEPGQVVCLVLHEADEASVQLLVALDLVLELTLLVPVQFFIGN